MSLCSSLIAADQNRCEAQRQHPSKSELSVVWGTATFPRQSLCYTRRKSLSTQPWPPSGNFFESAYITLPGTGEDWRP